MVATIGLLLLLGGLLLDYVLGAILSQARSARGSSLGRDLGRHPLKSLPHVSLGTPTVVPSSLAPRGRRCCRKRPACVLRRPAGLGRVVGQVDPDALCVSMSFYNNVNVCMSFYNNVNVLLQRPGRVLKATQLLIAFKVTESD